MGHKTGIEEYVILKDGKRLRCGYTTGTCAAAAAKAAAKMLLGGETVEETAVETPKGILLHLLVEEILSLIHILLFLLCHWFSALYSIYQTSQYIWHSFLAALHLQQHRLRHYPLSGNSRLRDRLPKL